MAHLGKFMKDKTLTKVNNFLSPWLDADESVIAVFQASRMKPSTGGLVLTNHRMLTTTPLVIGDIKIVDEIAADDILEFISEKGTIKARKLFVLKKDGEKVYIGSMYGEDALEVNSFLSSMSGTPQSVIEKLSSVKAYINHQYVMEKSQAHSSKEPVERYAENVAKQVAKKERKSEKAATVKSRGNKLGYVYIKYIGGYSPQLKKTFLEGTLECYENEVIFKSRGIVVPADQIVSFEITGNTQTNSRISVTRMVALGIFSLAAPKRSTTKEASVYIGMKDGRQILFQTTNLTESVVHNKLANAISHYSSLRVNNEGQQQSAPVQYQNAAEAILQFSDLRKQGIITDEEFEAKKKQLLDL